MPRFNEPSNSPSVSEAMARPLATEETAKITGKKLTPVQKATVIAQKTDATIRDTMAQMPTAADIAAAQTPTPVVTPNVIPNVIPVVTPDTGSQAVNPYAGNPPIQGADGFWYTQNADGTWVKGMQGMDTRNTSAIDDINSFFTGIGLSGLAAKAYGQWKQGIPISEIANNIQNSPEYAQRFPGMAALAKTGNRISEASYISKENTDRELMRNYLPAGAYDSTAQLGQLIASNVSSAELQNRLQSAHDSVLSTDPNVTQSLKDNYGLTQNDIAYWWLNPNKSLAEIQRVSNSSQMIATAKEAGFGINKTQAENLNNLGVDAQKSQGTFAKLGMDGQLQQNLPGNDTGAVSSDQLLGAAFSGNAADQQAINQVRTARVAQFQGNGGLIADNSGVVGLRSAAI